MRTKYLPLTALALLASTTMAQNKPNNIKKAAASVHTAKATKAQAPMSARAKALFEDMLPNTQKIFIIDSTIVNKGDELSAIPLPKDYGKFEKYDSFFNKTTGNGTYVFVNGFGNRCYYTETGTDSISRLYMRDKLGDAWGAPIAIKEINDQFSDISFPYMSSDGQTLYFAGVSNEEGLGQRDIYMTKYDADEGHFMQAENIGLPFNSSADDYAFVIADTDRMAWFATTRRQQQGKVCVYAFVPAETRQNYSEEELGHNKLVSLANIIRIRETWPTPEIRERALARLNRMRSKTDRVASFGDDISFVVNDDTTYTSIDQFKSDDTRKTYYEVTRLQNELSSTISKLETLRAQYHAASASDRTAIGSSIAQLEQKADSLRGEIKTNEQELRRKETNLLKKQ